MKHVYPKGGNRLCTNLYHALRREKWGQEKSNTARTLWLVADNASENKNNIFFAFLTELVGRGWYDHIELSFGPVGYTHNGIDAMHYRHNQLVGNMASVSLPEYIDNYGAGWTKSAAPAAVIMETQYNWTGMYDPWINKVSGFTKTVDNPEAVRAFEFKMDGGTPRMRYKRCPLDRDWLGQHQGSDSQGFQMLNSLPRFPPEEIMPDLKQCAAVAKGLTNPALATACTVLNRSTELKWVQDSAATGRSCLRGVRPPQPENRATWGTSEQVGTLRCWKNIEIIRRTTFVTEEEFWKLPPHDVAAAKAVEDLVRQEMKSIRTKPPPMKYVRAVVEMEQEEEADEEGEDTVPLSQMRRRKQVDPEEDPSLAPAVYAADLDEMEAKHDKSVAAPVASEGGKRTRRTKATTPRFGPDWKECEIGTLAVTKWDTEEGMKGIQVVVVVSKNRTDMTLTCEEYTCVAKTTSPDCMTAIWWLPDKKNRKQSTVNSYNVIGFFQPEGLKTKQRIPLKLRQRMDTYPDGLFSAL